MTYLSSPKLIPCFCPFLRIFKLEFPIQNFISRIIVNKNGISTYQNLNLSVDNQKQIKFGKLKMVPFFNGLLNTLRFIFSLSWK